ncbi:hypothetical protein K8S17_05580 [bacterium]|nr:hypothetical protein [bacterium]
MVRDTSSAQMPVFGRHATLISILTIIIVAFAFFHRVVLGGEILTGGDVLAAAAIFEDYAQSRIAGGAEPLWNPYIFSGMPYFESMTWNGMVYPSYWIRRVHETLPGGDLPRLTVVDLHYILAGKGTFC